MASLTRRASFFILLLTVVTVLSCKKVNAPRYDSGIELNINSVNIDGDEGSSAVVEVTCTFEWTATCSASWILLDKSSSNSSGKVLVSGSANHSGATRNGTVTFTSNGKSVELSVTQDIFRDRVSISPQRTCLAAMKDRPFTLIVKSNGNWTATVPSCFTASATSGTGDGEITLTLNNTTTKGNQTLTLRCGSATTNYTLSNVNQFANTYLITHGGSYCFAPCKCGGALVNGTQVDWIYKTDEDLFSDIVYDGQYIRFSAEAEHFGYGTIAMTDGNGKVLWSWMIWHTPELKTVNVGSAKWADRNVGAWSGYIPASTQPVVPPSAMGACFQWGRKDPFPGPDVEAIYKSPAGYRVGEGAYFASTVPYILNERFTPQFVNDESDPFSVDYGIAHPWCFAHKQYPTNDSVEKALWTSGKGVHDPCPPGWKVPTVSQLTSLKSAIYGSGWTKTEPYSNSFSKVYTSGSTVFFLPANGWTLYSRLNNCGRITTFWSCTWVSTDAMRRWYDNGDDISTGTDRMNRGFGVRCVTE